MKHRVKLALTGATSLFFTSSLTFAQNNQLVVVDSTCGIASCPPVSIYHVYAQFQSSTSRVNAWGIGLDFGEGFIRTLNPDGSTPGPSFTNIGGATGNLAPYSPGTTRDWDTYGTVGVRYGQQSPNGEDPTALIPGTPPFIVGNLWNGEGVGFFITPSDPQGRGDYIIDGHDTETRVLLMQLSVPQGYHVEGRIGVAAQQVTGAPIFAPPMGWYFNSLPSPGAIALIGVAALVGRRRRR